MRNYLTVFFLLFFIYCKAQISVYKWNQFGCSYEGLYDSLSVNHEQIGNAALLAFHTYYFVPFENPPLRKIDITQNYIDSLDWYYQKRKTEIVEMNLPHGDTWESLREFNLYRLTFFYDYHKIVLQALLNPKLLRSHLNSDTCYYYQLLLRRNTYLSKQWEVIVKDIYDGQQLEVFYNDKNNSLDYSYAIRKLLVRQAIERCSNIRFDINSHQVKGSPGDEWRNFFKVIKNDCDNLK